MPLYDYRCQECGHTFEQRHGWNDRAAACPACAPSSVQRQLPTFAVIGRAASAPAAVAESDPSECTPVGRGRIRNGEEGVMTAQRSRGLLAVLLILVTLLAMPSAPVVVADSGTILVDAADTTSDSGGCGDTANPCNTIQAGIDNASAGDTVSVAAGTYPETVNIDKGVTLSGDPGDATAGPGPEAPVLDGNGVVDSAITIAGGVSGVVIEGFEIRNYANNNLSGGIGSAVLAWSSTPITDVTVRDNAFRSLGWSAVLAGNEGQALHSGWTVTRNTVTDWSCYGIELTNTSDSTVTFNVLTATATTGGAAATGCGSDGSPDVAILIQSQQHGAGAGGTGSDVTVADNTISGVADLIGIYLLAWDSTNAKTSGLSDITVRDNRVSGAAGGVFVFPVGANADIHDVEISKNTLDGNAYGVQFLTSDGGALASVAVTKNRIVNSTGTSSGIRIRSDTPADGITVTLNSITGNARFGISHEGTGTLYAANNWWGSSRGPTHASNPRGRGDEISGAITFSPWCTRDGCKPPPTSKPAPPPTSKPAPPPIPTPPPTAITTTVVPASGGTVETRNSILKIPAGLGRATEGSAPVTQLSLKEIAPPSDPARPIPAGTEILTIQTHGSPIAAIEVHAVDANGMPISGPLNQVVSAQIRFPASNLPPGVGLDDLKVSDATLTDARFDGVEVVVEFDIDHLSVFVVEARVKAVIPELAEFYTATGGEAIWGKGLTNGFFVAVAPDGTLQEVPGDAVGALYIQVFENGAIGFNQRLVGTAREAWAVQPLLVAQILRAPGSSRDGIAPPVEPSGEGTYFAITGHNVSGDFLEHFITRGGIDVFGYPLTEAFNEVPGFESQYFQRLKLRKNLETGAIYIEQLGRNFLVMLTLNKARG